MKRFIPILTIMSLFVLLSNCKKDDDSKPNYEVSDIDKFIWEGLSDYYLWEDQAPYISEVKYNNLTERDAFLSTYDGDHEGLFYDLLYNYGEIDKWSWIVDDFVALENLFQGITKTMGFEYGLVRIGASDDIFGYVRYVLPDSPAAVAGIQRGDLFLKINDQQLTVSNYQDLLGNESYKISFASITNNTISPNGVHKNVTAVELQENPIHYSSVFEVNGKKVGYLVYNGFVSDFDEELNSEFSTFKTEGVQELILDLRYNGGGSIRSAIYLASMIYGTHTDKVFSQSQYNTALQAYLTSEYGADFFIDKFASEIDIEGGAKVPIQSLNLTRVYIICTGGTASASELVINGLKPYMDVVLIGTNTHGKYVGSITLKDYISSDLVNPNHTWAMQPIVLKIANSQGVSDYVLGFGPTIKIEEDLEHLSVIGNQSEPLLKAAIDHLNGVSVPKTKSAILYENVADSKDLHPMGKEMYLDREFLK